MSGSERLNSPSCSEGGHSLTHKSLRRDIDFPSTIPLDVPDPVVLIQRFLGLTRSHLGRLSTDSRVQLRLEEALLRADKANWCIINDGTPSPAIVMGISGKKDELIHMDAAKRKGIEIIKRFSGGGTVVVDHNTVFATLIMQAEAVPGVECYPRPVMQWSEGFYKPVFSPHGPFRLQEHDYTYGEQKFGGNAQAITKQRWLHHTSFLWDFDDSNMALLQHPSRVPKYRLERDHLAFICRLRDYMPKQAVVKGIECALERAGFDVQEVSTEDAQKVTTKQHIQNTHTIQL